MFSNNGNHEAQFMCIFQTNDLICECHVACHVVMLCTTVQQWTMAGPRGQVWDADMLTNNNGNHNTMESPQQRRAHNNGDPTTTDPTTTEIPQQQRFHNNRDSTTTDTPQQRRSHNNGDPTTTTTTEIPQQLHSRSIGDFVAEITFIQYFIFNCLLQKVKSDYIYIISDGILTTLT